MLNKQQLKEYRQLRNLTTRDVAAYCNLSQPMIVMLENGKRKITAYNHKEYAKGVVAAYSAKKMGTFIKPPRVNQPKKRTDRIKEEAN